MRDEVYQRLKARGITVDRAVYDAADSLVARALTTQIMRFVFGPQAEYARSLREDASIAKAQELLRGVTTATELLQRSKH